MTSHTIEIPEPIVTTQVEYNPAGVGHRAEHNAKLLVGGVVVMRRVYTSDYIFGQSPQPADFVNDEDHAADKIAAEFGHKLKELIGE